MKKLLTFNQQIPSRYWNRYIVMFMRYVTFHKVINLLFAFIYFVLNKKYIRTSPAFLKVELSRHCTIDCLYCGSHKEYKFFELETFKKLIDQFKGTLFLVQLHLIGEPLYYEHLVECIEYAHNAKVGVIFSTSLSVEKSDEFWEKIVLSGVDRMILSIDGLTPEVYTKYRRKGDLELIFKNLDKLLYYRNMHNSSIMFEWQMIKFEWNKHQWVEANRRANELGVDLFQLIQNAYEIRGPKAKKNVRRKNNCIWAYIFLVINVYGDILPCCKMGQHPGNVGNMFNEDIKSIWNGNEIYKIRDPKLIRKRPGCKTCCE